MYYKDSKWKLKTASRILTQSRSQQPTVSKYGKKPWYFPFKRRVNVSTVCRFKLLVVELERHFDLQLDTHVLGLMRSHSLGRTVVISTKTVVNVAWWLTTYPIWCTDGLIRFWALQWFVSWGSFLMQVCGQDALQWVGGLNQALRCTS